MRVVKFLIPLLLFGAISWFLYKGLNNDPAVVPSPLVSKPAPAFDLPKLDGSGKWSPEAFKGRVWMLNVWASWCAACVTEHSYLTELATRHKAAIVGLAWKDRRAQSIDWLKKYGNPYEVVVSDIAGDATIDYGVYGAPETFLIDKKGIIRHKVVGPVTPDILHKTLLPMILQLNNESL
jgi:cytochrome c biogenesis protein CcmG/thiol:disulfide interchange protein DsbE